MFAKMEAVAFLKGLVLSVNVQMVGSYLDMLILQLYCYTTVTVNLAIPQCLQ